MKRQYNKEEKLSGCSEKGCCRGALDFKGEAQAEKELSFCRLGELIFPNVCLFIRNVQYFLYQSFVIGGSLAVIF